MKQTCFLLIALLFAITALAAPQPDYSKLAPHPRLILKSGDIEALQKKIDSDELIRMLHFRIEDEAAQILLEAPATRNMVGKRLLDKSRLALKRICFCSYMYLISKDEQYARRAEKEMLAVAQFSDWNPKHFLDVGEMLAAVAIGYDWLYDWLSEDSRKIIETAIIEKGLRAATPKMWWYRSDNNWNQVCNGGMVMGALATFELIPEEAKVLIERSLKGNPKAQMCYGPDGIYPEGYGYWEYGTWYEVMLIESLRTALGSSFDLEKAPGFLESAKFMNFMQTPTNSIFSYSDTRMSDKNINPLLYWFAHETGDLSLLYTSRKLQREDESYRGFVRQIPLALLFAARCDTSNIKPVKESFWSGQGEQPLFIYRSDFDTETASYLAAKGGTPKTNHSHLDSGSFVYEWGGERWAIDLGSQSYYSLEKCGIRIWDKGQNSQRWSVYRLNNYSHNPLTVNERLHRYEGMTHMVKTYNSKSKHGAKFDMSEMFFDLESAYRTIYIDKSDKVTCIDELKTYNTNCDIRWNMVTPAKAKIIDEQTISLTQNGKEVILRTSTPRAKAYIMKNHSGKEYDQQNKGTLRVGFNIALKPGEKCNLKVELVPQK